MHQRRRLQQLCRAAARAATCATPLMAGPFPVRATDQSMCGSSATAATAAAAQRQCSAGCAPLDLIDALVRLRANPKQRRQRGTQLTCAERRRTCAVCHANDTYDRCARDGGGGGGSDRTQSGGSAARTDGRAALSARARRESAGIGSDRRKRITMFGLKSNQLCSCAPPHTHSPAVGVCARAAAAADASDQSEPTFCRCAAPRRPSPRQARKRRPIEFACLRAAACWLQKRFRRAPNMPNSRSTIGARDAPQVRRRSSAGNLYKPPMGAAGDGCTCVRFGRLKGRKSVARSLARYLAACDRFDSAAP